MIEVVFRKEEIVYTLFENRNSKNIHIFGNEKIEKTVEIDKINK